MRTVLLCFAAVLIVGAVIAGQARGHDAYHDWLMPNGGRCCTDLQRECRPVRSYFDDALGQFVIMDGGRWRLVPPGAVIAKPSPDGNSHACIGAGGTIFCFVNGAPKS